MHGFEAAPAGGVVQTRVPPAVLLLRRHIRAAVQQPDCCSCIQGMGDRLGGSVHRLAAQRWRLSPAGLVSRCLKTPA